MQQLHSDERNRFPRKRYDSDESSSSRDVKKKSTLQKGKSSRRKRYDSDDSASNEEGEGKMPLDVKPVKGKDRTASGHTAGLQNVQMFRDTELQIQERRRQDAQLMVDKYGIGETKYREQLGKADSSDGKKKKISLTREQEASLKTGKVQKEQELEMVQTYRELQQSTFARHADDRALETMKREVIRKDDPMANHERMRSSFSEGNPGKPIYKGPPSKPNRFGIRPGYRWDGVDRGNGFEDKVLARKYSTAYKEEQAYRWSTSDM
jgi:pre-mRNA-splicing factor CWC26